MREEGVLIDLMTTILRMDCVLVCLSVFFLFAGNLSARMVVIDAGHGGHDRGASWGKVYEKHLALDTALRLERVLQAKGVQTVMTRRSDRFLTLRARTRVGKYSRGAIFVSIHYNKARNLRANGLETFYFTPQGRLLASDVLSGMLRRSRMANRGVKKASYYVLQNNQFPAVLVECGFLSHRSDRILMKRAWFREAVARGITDGISRYWRRE